MCLSHIEHLVTDRASGRTFACRQGETLLNAAVRAGYRNIRVGCRAGGCGMCKVQVVGGHFDAGKMSRAHVSAVEASQGFVLACRTLPASALEFHSRIDSGMLVTGE